MGSCPYTGLEETAAASPERFALHRLECYRLYAEAPEIVPGRSSRDWMEATPERYAYRCLPLSIANAMGWELLSPCEVEAEWNGGPELADLTVAIKDPKKARRDFAASHFGSGILTFHVGYLFRTEPGVGLWARGVPNLAKDGIAALEGIIETDWLPFSFTMNWKFTRPGRITFAAHEPFCFITPLPYRALETVAPEILPIEANPAVQAAHKAWADARTAFNAGLKAEDPAIVKQGWQKWYMRGEDADHGKGNAAHLSKLSLAAPILCDPAKVNPPEQE
jgi:Family of unknown function (DUF6065)